MLDKSKNIGYNKPYLRNINVRWFDFNLDDLLEMPFTQNELERYSIKKNDLVICEGGEPGRCAIWDKDETIMFQKALHRLRMYCGISPYYISFYLLYLASTGQLNNYFTGSGIKHLTGESLANIEIPLPPLNEQNHIVKELDNWIGYANDVDSNKGLLLKNLDAAKSKILELAMRGKLVPQDPADEPAADMLRRINPKARIITDNPHYPQLPDNWALSTIKDVFIINPKNKVDDSTLAGFVPMASIDDGYSNSFTFVTKEWGAIKSGFTHFADGDIAVAKISPCLENRKSMVVKGLPNGIGSGTTELLVFRSDTLISEYGLLFFKSDNFIKKCVSTYNGVVGQQRVGKGIVEEIALPIPPVNEQKKIVGVVKYLFNVLENIRVSLD